MEKAARKAHTWLAYQSPDDMVLVAQQPTSDWRDEQWVEGFGLYVNTLVYAALRLFGQNGRAEVLRGLMNRFEILGGVKHRHVHEGLSASPQAVLRALVLQGAQQRALRPLGQQPRLLTGIASPFRARKLAGWTEEESDAMQGSGGSSL